MINSLSNRQMNPIISWQREMNRLFDQFNRELEYSRTDFEGFEPRVEVKEKNKEYILRAEVPGIPEKNIHVTLRDNCVIIEGEKKQEEEREERGIYQSEFSYGSFYREIPLEDEVDPAKVHASYKNGILSVHLMKSGEQKSHGKQIPITLS